MPYIYIGQEAIYHGRPLMKILCNLRNFGVGRIVYRNNDFVDYPDQVHFYRILKAQPLVGKEKLEGNVVVERVYKNLRHPKPFVISDLVHKTDFRLVPKDEEAEFCKWDQIKDYDPSRDAPVKPKFVEMGPLLKEVVKRSKAAKGITNLTEEDLLLPAFENYEGDHILDDTVRPHKLSQFITGQFKISPNYDVEKEIPESWADMRPNLVVGHKMWHGFTEGLGWEEQQKREQDEKEFKSGKSKASEEVQAN